jgi:hypothetical protein
MDLRKTLETACLLLSGAQIKFALIGGFALGAHGIHRATKDIDLLVDGSQKELAKKIFLKEGFKIIFESNEVLQMVGIGYVDIVFANRPLSLEMLLEAQNGAIKFFSAPVVTCEALIGLKIQAYKNDPSRELKDKADILDLLKAPDINRSQVKKYADLFDAWSEINDLMGKT